MVFMLLAVAGISLWYRLVLPISVEYLDLMLSNSLSNQEETISLTSCGTCVSCNIFASLFELLCSL